MTGLKSIQNIFIESKLKNGKRKSTKKKERRKEMITATILYKLPITTTNVRFIIRAFPLKKTWMKHRTDNVLRTLKSLFIDKTATNKMTDLSEINITKWINWNKQKNYRYYRWLFSFYVILSHLTNESKYSAIRRCDESETSDLIFNFFVVSF